MSDYIDREAVMQKFADHVKRSNNSDFAPWPTWNQAVQIVEDFPAADVRPVVTCGRCKYADSFSPTCTEATFPLKCLSIRYGGVYPDWFCEHGEKREES